MQKDDCENSENITLVITFYSTVGAHDSIASQQHNGTILSIS